MMEILENIPLNINFEDYRDRLKVKNGSRLHQDLEDLFQEGIKIARPRAIYRVEYIEERTDDTIKLSDTLFNSKPLKDNLNGIERVFPYIVTCGRELDELLTENDDLLEQYWVDVFKEIVLRQSQKFLKNRIKEKYKIKILSSMNPGSGEASHWPLSDQKNLFSIFGDVESMIGVKLTDSFLMIPNKTISGIYFPSEVEYITCQYCSRENCPGRRAPYQGENEELDHG